MSHTEENDEISYLGNSFYKGWTIIIIIIIIIFFGGGWGGGRGEGLGNFLGMKYLFSPLLVGIILYKNIFQHQKTGPRY